MKIIQLISIKFEMKNIGIIVYGRFPTEKAYGSHIIDIADGFLENNCNVHVFYSKSHTTYTSYVSVLTRIAPGVGDHFLYAQGADRNWCYAGIYKHKNIRTE